MPKHGYTWLSPAEAEALTRVCSKCGIEQSVTAFCPNPRYRGGRQRICRTCQRPYQAKYRTTPEFRDRIRRDRASGKLAKMEHNKKLRYNYGLSLADYKAMLVAQGECCAICGNPEKNPRRRRLSVDHDHATGVIRGLLCDMCNRGIGYFADDAAILARAITYLERSRSVSAGAVKGLPLAVNE